MSAAATGPSRVTRRRGDALLEAIYEAVLEELAEAGYAGLSIERVADRAHTGKASIYRRWPSRFELVVDALDHALPFLAEPPPDTGSVRGDLLVVLRRVARTMSGTAGTAARACLGHLDQDAEVGRAVRDRVLPHRKAVIAAVLQRGVARGEVRPEAVTDRITELGPMLLHAEAVARGVPIPDEAVVAIVDEIVLPVLTPRDPLPAGPPSPQRRHPHLPG